MKLFEIRDKIVDYDDSQKKAVLSVYINGYSSPYIQWEYDLTRDGKINWQSYNTTIIPKSKSNEKSQLENGQQYDIFEKYDAEKNLTDYYKISPSFIFYTQYTYTYY